MLHTCNAVGCKIVIHPSRIMCIHHWQMIPKQFQIKIWELWRADRFLQRESSNEYSQAIAEAQNWIIDLGADQ